MQLASLRAMDEAGVYFMYFLVSNYTDQSASLESASCLRRKRDCVVAPHPQADRPTCRAKFCRRVFAIRPFFTVPVARFYFVCLFLHIRQIFILHH